MKKVFVAIIALLLISSGCTSKGTPRQDVVEIKEKLFIAQCEDIYLNPEQYKGKTIKFEGIYQQHLDSAAGINRHFVIRYSPGCCGDDGVVGFEVLYDGTLPKQDDWVEAIGKIEMLEANGAEYVGMRLSKLTVLDKRGAEFVIN